MPFLTSLPLSLRAAFHSVNHPLPSPARLLALILTLGFTAARPARAQELTIVGVPATPVQVLPLEGGGYSVLYRSEAGEDGRDIHALRFLGPDLKVRHEIALEVPARAPQLAAIPQRTTLGLAYGGAGGVLLHTLNSQSGAHQQTVVPFGAVGKRQTTSAPLVVATPTEGYCVLQPTGTPDTSGFRLTLLDAALQSKWTKVIFPTDKRGYQAQQLAVSKDAVVVVFADSYVVRPGTRTARNFTDYYVAGFDPATGRELYRKPLRQSDGLTLLPTHLLALTDGRVAAAGQYFSSRTMRSDSTLGAFTLSFKPDGSFATPPALTAWADLGQRLGDAGLAKQLQEGRTSLALHSLTTTTGTDARLLAEVSAAGNRPAQFVATGLDAAGQRTALYPINRSLRTPDAASRLIGVTGTGADATVLYSGTEGQTLFVYATPLADQPSRTAARGAVVLDPLPEVVPYVRPMPADPISGGLGAFSNKMKAIDANVNRAMNGEPAPEGYRGDATLRFASGGPGQTVVYRFEPTHKQLRMYVQEVK